MSSGSIFPNSSFPSSSSKNLERAFIQPLVQSMSQRGYISTEQQTDFLQQTTLPSERKQDRLFWDQNYRSGSGLSGSTMEFGSERMTIVVPAKAKTKGQGDEEKQTVGEVDFQIQRHLPRHLCGSRQLDVSSGKSLDVVTGSKGTLDHLLYSTNNTAKTKRDSLLEVDLTDRYRRGPSSGQLHQREYQGISSFFHTSNPDELSDGVKEKLALAQQAQQARINPFSILSSSSSSNQSFKLPDLKPANRSSYAIYPSLVAS